MSTVNHLAAHIGQETTIEACGRTWRLSRLTRRITRQFETWAAGQLTNPLETARHEVEQLARRAAAIAGDQELDEATRQTLLEANRRQQDQITAQALDRSQVPLSVRSNALLGTVEGSTEMLRLLLVQHQPSVSEDDAYAILMEIGIGLLQAKIDEAAGIAPPKNPLPPVGPQGL